jgi:hypothetical protein
MSKNDITGDSLVNKPLSKQGEENWDRIFGKKKEPLSHEEFIKVMLENEEVYKELSRMDVIGQNGNDGDHYEYELNPSTGDVEKRFKEGISKPNGEQFDE